VQKIKEHLVEGKEVECKLSGGSMQPIIPSGSKVRIVPIRREDVQVDDIVFCRVKGSYKLHKVFSIDDKRGFKIGNNHGHINGWTKSIYGKFVGIVKDEK